MIRIAVTGGFCSGKTRVTRFFSERGCPSFSCDNIVREFYADRKIAQQVCSILGEDVISPDGKVDIHKIWRIFFSDMKKKKMLEDFIHPLVFERLAAGFDELKKDASIAMAVAEVPLLKTDMDLFDVVLLTACYEDTVVERAEERGYPPGLADAVLRLGMGFGERVMLADYVIWNNSTLASLARRTNEIYDALSLKKA